MVATLQHYGRHALGVYGWTLLVFERPLCGPPLLATACCCLNGSSEAGVQPGCCGRVAGVRGDTCCFNVLALRLRVACRASLIGSCRASSARCSSRASLRASLRLHTTLLQTTARRCLCPCPRCSFPLETSHRPDGRRSFSVSAARNLWQIASPICLLASASMVRERAVLLMMESARCVGILQQLSLPPRSFTPPSFAIHYSIPFTLMPQAANKLLAELEANKHLDVAFRRFPDYRCTLFVHAHPCCTCSSACLFVSSQAGSYRAFVGGRRGGNHGNQVACSLSKSAIHALAHVSIAVLCLFIARRGGPCRGGGVHRLRDDGGGGP